jgi:hypothetical protein
MNSSFFVVVVITILANVMKTDKWKKMKKENPSALFELLEIAFGSTSTTV